MSEVARIITSAGVGMPGMIYGTAWKKQRTAELVVQAIEAGFQGIDTACQPKHYDEALVGEGLRRLAQLGIKRDALYVQTKFTPLSGQDPAQVPYNSSAPLAQQVKQSFAQSKKNLQTDYVDGFILHSPLASHGQTMEAWSAMEEIQQAGGTQQLGISNCYDLTVLQALHAEARIKPSIVQNRFYKDTNYDTELRHWCDSHDVIFQSFWTLTANKHVLASPVLHTLADKYRKTPVQIFFRCLTQMGIVPLTGTTSMQHMGEDLDIFAFTLEAEDLEEIMLLIKSRPE